MSSRRCYQMDGVDGFIFQHDIKVRQAFFQKKLIANRIQQFFIRIH